MAHGNREFQQYCKEHNIPGSHQVWAYAMWRHVEEKFTSTNSAMDAIALLKLANDAHTNNWVDSWFTSNKQAVNAVVAQQHQ